MQIKIPATYSASIEQAVKGVPANATVSLVPYITEHPDLSGIHTAYAVIEIDTGAANVEDLIKWIFATFPPMPQAVIIIEGQYVMWDEGQVKEVVEKEFRSAARKPMLKLELLKPVVHLQEDGKTIRGLKESVDLSFIGRIPPVLYHNRNEIIGAAQGIEENLTLLISDYFFKWGDPLKDEFNTVILRTSFCSFADKKKIVRWIIQKLQLMDKKQMEAYEKLILDVGKWRNAFAHGLLGLTLEEDAYLNYFHNEPKTVKITEELLLEIRDIMRKANWETSALVEAFQKKQEKATGQR